MTNIRKLASPRNCVDLRQRMHQRPNHFLADGERGDGVCKCVNGKAKDLDKGGRVNQWRVQSTISDWSSGRVLSGNHRILILFIAIMLVPLLHQNGFIAS